jgi:hypothetical protein
MKIIAEILKYQSGALIPWLYAVGEDGKVDESISRTLLDFISESYPPADEEFESLLSTAEAGKYVPKDPSLPDWSVNDKNVWLVPPRADAGNLCISNENASDYSVDDGHPQQFSIQQFRAALEHWRSFLRLIQEKGKENIVGKKFETLIP